MPLRYQDEELRKALKVKDRHLFLTVMRGQLNEVLLKNLPEGVVTYGKQLESTRGGKHVAIAECAIKNS